MTDALRISVQYRGGELLSRTLTSDCILIGREADCELRLDHPDVSRHHACITRKGPHSYLLRDLVSSNGTFVQEESVSFSPIREGGHVRIADFDLTFRLVDVPWSEGEEPATTVSRIWEQDTIRIR
jgi:pSer/pThr/pTyr-binding forkhead associated (FHA) protein